MNEPLTPLFAVVGGAVHWHPDGVHTINAVVEHIYGDNSLLTRQADNAGVVFRPAPYSKNRYVCDAPIAGILHRGRA